MRKLFWVLTFWLCSVATTSNAHNWQQDLQPLKEADAINVLTLLEETGNLTSEAPPTLEDSIDFFELIALRLGDEEPNIARILFMFEAIRQGSVVAGQFVVGSEAFVWADRIYLDDYEVVFASYERLDAWFNKQLEETKK